MEHRPNSTGCSDFNVDTSFGCEGDVLFSHVKIETGAHQREAYHNPSGQGRGRGEVIGDSQSSTKPWVINLLVVGDVNRDDARAWQPAWR